MIYHYYHGTKVAYSNISRRIRIIIIIIQLTSLRAIYVLLTRKYSPMHAVHMVIGLEFVRKHLVKLAAALAKASMNKSQTESISFIGRKIGKAGGAIVRKEVVSPVPTTSGDDWSTRVVKLMEF